MDIRDMVAGDYASLSGLWDAAGLSYRPNGRDARERIEREISGPCSVFLIAEDADGIVGAVLGTHDGRKGWINRLVVHPDHRRRGIATALVVEVERRLERIGIEIVTCLVEGWNAESMAFFESLGFVSHDIRYYSRRKRSDV